MRFWEGFILGGLFARNRDDSSDAGSGFGYLIMIVVISFIFDVLYKLFQLPFFAIIRSQVNEYTSLIFYPAFIDLHLFHPFNHYFINIAILAIVVFGMYLILIAINQLKSNLLKNGKSNFLVDYFHSVFKCFFMINRVVIVIRIIYYFILLVF